MATHDYIISNASGAAVRADLNNALAAIASNNSSATEPTTTYAYQWWADTGSSPTVMKLRNAANSAWITLFQLDGEWSLIPFENGTAAAPSIYFKDSGTDTGIFSPGTDQVGISAGGTSRFEVSTSATTSTLPVVHPLGAVGTPSITFTGDLNTGIWSPAADTVAVSTNGTRAITIDSSQRLGIGSTSPDTLLHIRGSGSPGIHITEVGGGSGSGNLYMNNNICWLNADSSGSSLAFACGGGSEKARITAQGQLLVGTSSYSGDGTIVARGSSAGAATQSFLVLQRGQTNPAPDLDLGTIRFTDAAGSLGAQITAQTDTAFSWGTNDYPTRLVFSTTVDGASSPTARMAILNTGELRLGSTNQTAISADACHTIGSVTLETVQTNLARLVIQERANNWISFKNGAGTHYGTISVSGAGVTYGSNSDYRLKENVFAIGQPVEKLKLLKPCQYSFIAIPGQRVDGFLAHELQEVVPSAVSGTKDATDANGNPEYQTVDASKLVPLLTAALQEAIGEIESLKARVTALESA